MVTKPGVPLAARVKLSAVAFEEDEHEEGEEEVEFFVGGEVADLLDLEAAFEKSGEFGEAHRGLAVGAGGEVAGVEEVAGGEAEEGDLAEEGVGDF